MSKYGPPKMEAILFGYQTNLKGYRASKPHCLALGRSSCAASAASKGTWPGYGGPYRHRSPARRARSSSSERRRLRPLRQLVGSENHRTNHKSLHRRYTKPRDVQCMAKIKAGLGRRKAVPWNPPTGNLRFEQGLGALLEKGLAKRAILKQEHCNEARQEWQKDLQNLWEVPQLGGVTTEGSPDFLSGSVSSSWWEGSAAHSFMKQTTEEVVFQMH